jgi:hypothetical protein
MKTESTTVTLDNTSISVLAELCEANWLGQTDPLYSLHCKLTRLEEGSLTLTEDELANAQAIVWDAADRDEGDYDDLMRLKGCLG